MKRLLALTAGLIAFAGAAFADPIEGVWQTQVDDGAYAYITIAPCAANFCGAISRTFKSTGEYKSPNIGKMLVIDLAASGEGKYKGKVWRPSNDKIYIAKVDLNGDALKLRGCIAGGLLCSAQNWTRLK